MRPNKKYAKWLAATAALLLALTLCLPVGALTPAHGTSAAYRASTYYQNLSDLPRTGDKAFDTVAIALSQLGYHEGNGTADFGGKNTGGYKNYTEYNRAFGKIGGSYGYAWCAAFVSWCLGEAHAADAAGGRFASCTLWVERLQALGRYSTRASGYTPKAGDLIFFRSAGVGRASDHVGLVRYVQNGRVYTVEGNSSDRVSLRDYALTDTYIVGYGRPRYDSAYRLSSTALKSEDVTAGWYTVTNDFLNVRAGRGSGTAKRGTLYQGSMVKVTDIQNGWGTVYYNGKTAYISLDYADFTAPLRYTVSYRGEEGVETPPGFAYFSMDTAFAARQTPERDGFTFLYWEDGKGATYGAGERLPAGDLTLTAKWEPIPVTVPPTEAPPPMEEGSTDDFLSGPTAPENTTETAPVTGDMGENTPQADGKAPAIAAGVVTGALTAVLAVLWYLKKRKETA